MVTTQLILYILCAKNYNRSRIQMSSFYLYANQVVSFSLIPYLAMAIFTILYFAYQKRLIMVKIRNIPAFTIFNIDLEKVKKNLQIKSMIHTFILLIYSFEALVCLFWSIGTIYYVFIYDDMTDQHNVILNISTNVSCTSTHESIFSLFLDISYYLLATLPVLINLLLIVLRRAYLSCPYKIWVQIFTFYIISRILIPFLTSHFILIRYFCCLSVLPFVIIDFFVYINTSKNFLLLLKGRSDEARIHSTRSVYRSEKRIATIFSMTRYLTVFAFGIGIILCLIRFIIEVVSILDNSECLFDQVFPNSPSPFILSNKLVNMSHLVVKYCVIIRMIPSAILATMVTLSNLFILICIITKLLRRRKQFNQINDLVTPLMEYYRASLMR